MADPNIPIGAGEDYPRKSAPFSREIIDAMKQLLAVQGEKGDMPGHEWNPAIGHETEIRFQNPNGTWGAWVDLQPDPAAIPTVVVEYSVTGEVGTWHNVYVAGDIYMRLSFDNRVTWTAALRISGGDGLKGDNADALMIQYSADNIAWFNTVQNPTNYIHFSVDGGTIWTDGIYVKGSNGTNGTNGTNAYLYVAWASDDQGTDFSLVFNNTLHYRAELQSTVLIANPLSTHFTGLWKYMRGTSGANAYVYIGYASDDIGSNFSIIPATGLDYMAVLNTDIYIDPNTLTAANFVGLWRSTRGASGVPAYFIELPYRATLHERCIDGTVIKPLGWLLDSGDQMPLNPLSSNPLDLVIRHNLNIETVDVVVKSFHGGKVTKLIGPVAYSTFEDDSGLNYLCIKSFSTTETTLRIFIKTNE